MEFDFKSGKCYDEYGTTFRSYMSLLGWKKTILIEDWGQIEPEAKENTWADVAVLILTYMIWSYKYTWPFIYFINTIINFLMNM